jgi:hypothetical protein
MHRNKLIQILYGKPLTREFSSDLNVSRYEVPTNFSGFKVFGHGTKSRRFTIGFVAACVKPVFYYLAKGTGEYA